MAGALVLTRVGWGVWLSIRGPRSLLYFPPVLNHQQLLVPFYWMAEGDRTESCLPVGRTRKVDPSPERSEGGEDHQAACSFGASSCRRPMRTWGQCPAHWAFRALVCLPQSCP